jgi:hypothetical protein
MEELKMAMEQSVMTQNIVFADKGDKIKLRSGEIVEFVKLNRTKFVFARGEAQYNTPIDNFVEIVEKAPVKKLNQSYKKLKSGDLFYIDHKDSVVVFSFEEMRNGKLQARHVIDGGKISIDLGLYGGTINELKKIASDKQKAKLDTL